MSTLFSFPRMSYHRTCGQSIHSLTSVSNYFRTLTTTPMTWCTTCNTEHFTDHICSSLLIKPATVNTLVAILEEDAIIKWTRHTDMVELITVCDYFLLDMDVIKKPLMHAITHLHCQFPDQFKVPELIYRIYHSIYSDFTPILCDWITFNNRRSFLFMQDITQATALAHFKSLRTFRILVAHLENPPYEGPSKLTLFVNRTFLSGHTVP